MKAALSEMGKMLSLRRRARRKFVIAYWAALILLIGTLAETSWRHGPGFADKSFIWFWWTLILFPWLTRSIVNSSTRGSELQTLMKPAESGRGLEPRPMDERELSLHNKIYTKAYYLLQIFVPAGVLLVTAPEMYRYSWLTFARIPLLWLLSLLVTSMPDTMILWTAPDMDPDA